MSINDGVEDLYQHSCSARGAALRLPINALLVVADEGLRLTTASCIPRNSHWHLSKSRALSISYWRPLLRVGDCSTEERSMTFKPQATGAMRLQRLPAEMLTTQQLTDDTDSLVPVDRLRRIRLGQGWIVFPEFFTNP